MSANAEPESAREIVTTRLFRAPRERVFAVWSSAAHLEKWWGPRGFSTTTHAFDFRPGGEWRLTMHGPDGTDYANRVVYTEIVPPSRIVYAHHGDGETVHFHTTVTFTDEDGGTRVTMRALFPTAAARALVIERYHADTGAKENMDRMGEHLRSFQTSREIPASPEQVFAAFSDPQRLARWWGPAGFTNTFEVCDFRPGGRWKFVMHGPDGANYANESAFAEIEPAKKIVVEHLSAPNFVLTITLTPSAGGTTLTWTQVLESAEIVARVEAIVVPANEQNLDRLTAEVLRSISA
jgi:uncharacterized protein YndB with AHSA1/START domain